MAAEGRGHDDSGDSKNPLDEYDLGEELGRGASGIARKAIQKRSGRTVCIKEVRVSDGTAEEDIIEGNHDAAEETRRLQNLTHPNIALFLDAFQVRGGRHYFVMEFIDGGSLEDAISLRRGPCETTELAQRFVLQVASALQKLHGSDPPIGHCHLKPGNVRLTRRGTAKVVDLGNTILSTGSAEKGVNTLAYMSRARLESRSHPSAEDDCWALGLIVVEVSLARPYEELFPGLVPAAMRQDLINTHIEEVNERDPVLGEVAAGLLRLSWSAERVVEFLQTHVRPSLSEEADRGAWEAKVVELTRCRELELAPSQEAHRFTTVAVGLALLELSQQRVDQQQQQLACVEDGHGWTILHAAMAMGWYDMVQAALQGGAIDSVTSDGVRASSLRPRLWRSVTGKEPAEVYASWPFAGKEVEQVVSELIDVILDNGIRNEAVCARVCLALDMRGRGVLNETGEANQTFRELYGRERWTLLTAAAIAGRLSVCRLLLEAGAEIDRTRDNGETPLYVACENGRLDCARLLLDRGAEANKARSFGATPLYVACENGQLDCARLLLNRGASVDKARNNGGTPLHFACQEGQLDCARLLLDRGASVDKARDDGVTPLLIACENGQLDCARLLLNRGASVEKTRDNGMTPLWTACCYGHLRCTFLLLERGAQVDKARNGDATPLHTACHHHYRHVAALLLERGADPRKRGERDTPAGHARMKTPDPDLAEVMELAIACRVTAIQRLRAMAAEGPKQCR